MANPTVKTTIEIADDLFERAQRLAREEKTTFRSLAEQGLRLVLQQQEAEAQEASSPAHGARTRDDRGVQERWPGRNS